jgi:hypothetical protein
VLNVHVKFRQDGLHLLARHPVAGLAVQAAPEIQPDPATAREVQVVDLINPETKDRRGNK